jgi:UDP-N-acetylglucosamine diphosphorylase / glucose-1-phosphate thymidylyltransferase / UDP-N-acetylgalactosamine diphosphorylase / glucosamine-1-phosphate N-acetyltransferase / galactosamine-1-phosphate N-acetyltransferase
MINIQEFIKGFDECFEDWQTLVPWQITADIKKIIHKLISNLQEEYRANADIVIHPTAIIEEGAVIKGPAWISEGCFVAACAYLRDGVFLGKNVSIGPGCELKASIVMNNTHLAHFNFIGNSIIGNDVNFEAGALIANHYNERIDKSIRVLHKLYTIETKVEKFGGLIGDYSKVGANAVLSPGTLLPVNSIVKRLELIEQNPLPK